VTTAVLEPAATGRSVEQRIRYDYSGPVTNVRQRLMVVPPLRHGRQRRVDWSLRVEGAPAESVRTRRDAFGNMRIDVVIPRVQSWVEFEVGMTIAFTDGDVAATVRHGKRYVRPTQLTASDDNVGRLLSPGERHEPELICARVHGALTYEYGITDVHTTAAEALLAERGVCQDYAHLMVAACRQAGLPARYVSGHLAGDGGSHAWVEVLHQDRSRAGMWVAEGWDPTHGRRTDASYVTIATGRDYADVAPMSGTFDGDAGGRLTVQKHVGGQPTAAGPAQTSP
jgi:transglutaminase-like putative cysteine protease